MIRSALFTLLFFIISTFSFANEYDSLLTIVKKSSGIKKATALQDLAWICRKTNVDSSFLLTQKAIEIAKAEGDQASESKSILCEARINTFLKKYEKAEGQIKTALALSTKIKDRVGIMYAYYRYASLYEKTNQLQKAKDNVVIAIDMAKSLNDLKVLPDAYECSGRVAYYMGYYEDAMADFKNALSIYAKQKDESNISGVSMNLGIMYFRTGKIDESLIYYNKALKSFQALQDTLDEAKCYENIAMSLETINIDSAIVIQKRAIKLYKILKNKESNVSASLNLGNLYSSKGDYAQAIKYTLVALKMYESSGDKKGMAQVYSNMSGLYNSMNQDKQAISYVQKAIKLYQEIGDEYRMSNAYRQLGSIYQKLKEFDKAIDYINKSIVISEKFKDEQGLANANLTLGNCYQRSKQPDKALDCFLKALSFVEGGGDLVMTAGLYSNIGVIYFDKKNYPKANEYYQKSLEIRKGLGSLQGLTDSYETLANINYELKNYKVAYDYQKLYVEGKEQILNGDITKQISEMNAKYQSEKKASQIKLLRKEQQTEKIKHLESTKRNNILLFSALIFIVLCVAIAFILFRSNKKQQKANVLLENKNTEILRQKHLVEEKNAEILDSITYAKRIQNAILPPDKVVKEYLNDSFILYKPKDIVAGDFYWMEQKEGKVLFAAADCTGHGVPGAMVSVVCNNGLNRSVREYGLSDPGKILDETRRIVVEEFEKSEDDVKDGMDIAMCSLEGNILKYAGANNPLWILRKGSDSIEEIKATKQAIGKVDNPTPFTTHTVELNEGDSIYIFSDGFADQFGGGRGKKYKGMQLKELILTIKDKAMQDQKTAISQSFEKWRGELEQVDDVCVIGVRFEG